MSTPKNDLAPKLGYQIFGYVFAFVMMALVINIIIFLFEHGVRGILAPVARTIWCGAGGC